MFLYGTRLHAILYTTVLCYPTHPSLDHFNSHCIPIYASLYIYMSMFCTIPFYSSLSMSEFTKSVNDRFTSDTMLQDGYAPFCKHLFVKNDFTDARVNVLPITTENRALLRSDYQARNDKELPVLQRWFPADDFPQDKLPVAQYLDLILYSREQIEKETAAQGQTGKVPTFAEPWGIVSIKAQDVNHELPMTPITAMRNALGKEEGGSGVPLDRESYMKAYEYWKDHATIS